jgi:rare lipoprotein A
MFSELILFGKGVDVKTSSILTISVAPLTSALFAICWVLTGAPAHAAGKVQIAAICTQYGSRTASGERFAPNKLTAAHRTLPLGTLVRVTNLRNGRSVVVRINDRGPFTKGRTIDVSPAAAKQLEFSGMAPVTLAVVSK